MILSILSFIAGIAFIGAGIYFLSQKYLNKMIDACPDKSEEGNRRTKFRAKGTAYTAFALGALTLVFASMLLTVPGIEAALSLTYMILLVAAFGVLIIIYK